MILSPVRASVVPPWAAIMASNRAEMASEPACGAGRSQEPALAAARSTNMTVTNLRSMCMVSVNQVLTPSRAQTTIYGNTLGNCPIFQQSAGGFSELIQGLGAQGFVSVKKYSSRPERSQGFSSM